MDEVRKIADAVLYEGYLLWPYTRGALKNQRRWTFGGVYPPSHSSAHPDDPCSMRTECLALGDVDVSVRFLHVVRRQVFARGGPVSEAWAGGERFLSWDEATERTFEAGAFAVPAGQEVEDAGDGVSIVRSWRALSGVVSVSVDPPRVAVTVENTTRFSGSREDALLQTFCSTHVVLRGGPFVSLADPPDELRDAAAACVNEGTWPVLVGEHDTTMLSSPIILEDHPRVAPESPGDLFDGGEVDELLVFNILSLTDEEKAEIRAADPRAREILERTERLSTDEILRLHGAWR
jgi:hydrogenase maturation protease